jgi:hypothetical protein
MISDTLSDAKDEIEEYQHYHQEVYGKWQVHIWKVTTVMDALRTWLDCPPSDGVYPRYEAAMGRLRAEIANLDVEPLLRAMDDLKAAWPTPEEVEAANMQAGAEPSTHQGQDGPARGNQR